MSFGCERQDGAVSKQNCSVFQNLIITYPQLGEIRLVNHSGQLFFENL